MFNCSIFSVAIYKSWSVNLGIALFIGHKKKSKARFMSLVMSIFSLVCVWAVYMLLLASVLVHYYAGNNFLNHMWKEVSMYLFAKRKDASLDQLDGPIAWLVLFPKILFWCHTVPSCHCSSCNVILEFEWRKTVVLLGVSRTRTLEARDRRTRTQPWMSTC